MKTPVVFTDLDGTLLDHATYSHEPALPALRLLRERRIPLVFCSSKTRTEIEHYRRRLDNHEPFVSENGGGLFIPAGYFEAAALPPGLDAGWDGGYLSIRLGAPYARLRQAVHDLRREGFALTGFGDMTVAEIAGLTGLPPDQAAMARERDFDEPFVFAGSEAEGARLQERIRELGLCSTRGAFFHLLGSSDKGAAMEILLRLFRAQRGELFAVALGDSYNDLPMLQRADVPVAVRKGDGGYDPHFAMPRLIKTEQIGPAGWNEAILGLFGGSR